MSNYGGKADLKNETDVDTSNFVKTSDLVSLKLDSGELILLINVPSGLNSLKSKVDKLYVDKVKPVPTD